MVKKTRYGLVDPVVGDTVEVTFHTNFGGIAAGETLSFPVAGTENSRAFIPVEAVDAEVIASDAQGFPALLRRKTGAGSMVLATYPFEHFAASTPFVNPEPTWRLYDALATEAGVRRTVTVPDGRVAASELVHDDGRNFVWFVNHSDETASVVPVVEGRLVAGDGSNITTVELGPFAVVVLERRAA